MATHNDYLGRHRCTDEGGRRFLGIEKGWANRQGRLSAGMGLRQGRAVPTPSCIKS